MTVAALILAGGQATRLAGIDKALLTLNGETLAARALRRLALPCTALSANGDLARFAPLGIPVLPDDPTHAGKGPLAGVLAGLRHWAANADVLLTIPVDTPFFPTTIAIDLAPGPSVAVWSGRQHHLVALWPTAFAAALETFLHTPGPHRVRDALTLCAARPVNFPAPTDPFLNINTPADWATARAMLSDL